MQLPSPPDFRLGPTIRSHGWSDLPPFAADGAGTSLTVHFGPSRATVRQRGARLEVDWEGEPAPAALGSCLRFDLDLAEFWALCEADPELAWVAQERAGRFLRAPTAFADAAMVLATTNCTWGRTRQMVAALVRHWGLAGAFPTQERLARVRPATLERCMGYRAPYLSTLARGLCLERFRTDDRPTEELRHDLLELPGFGPYAADNMLRLLGRFEHLALDSWVIRRWKERHPRRRATDRAIGRQFARYGRFRGLAFWLTLTAHWYRPKDWRV